jgi:carbonic anhydrase/acetyltransferase-like protein (isoleucine patch superfamily)
MNEMSVHDRLSRHLSKKCKFGSNVFIAPTAVVIGDVTLGDQASVWYNTVLRGDINSIVIGHRTNIQDGVVGHLSDDYPLVVGNDVTVGHGAVIHACTIGNECLIGMNSTILDGVKIGCQSIIAAGSVVPVGTEIPEGSLFAGVPGRVKRALGQVQRSNLKMWAEKYLAVANAHRKR